MNLKAKFLLFTFLPVIGLVESSAQKLTLTAAWSAALDESREPSAPQKIYLRERIGAPSNAPVGNFIPVSIPPDLGWDSTHYPLTFGLYDVGNGNSVGWCSHTPEQLFDLFSTARSAPAATYYVSNSTGSDTNDGLTSGTAFGSIQKATNVANAGGVPTKIFVASSTGYVRAQTFSASGGRPAVDIAYIATGGNRVVAGVFDAFSAPSLDGTYTRTYALSLTGIQSVWDIRKLDRNGLYTPLQLVETAAICNETPGSYAIESSTLHIRRADGDAVTNSNTRIFRTSAQNLTLDKNVSIFLGGETEADGFDLQGGNSSGCVSVYPTDSPTARRAFVAKNCTFRYCGGLDAASGNGIAVDNYHGIAAFFNCDASANATDGFNRHNALKAVGTDPFILTVNCTATANGSNSNAASCNNLTLHENVVGIDIASNYGESNGGSVRNIGASRALLAGTVSGPDRGDLHHSTSGAVRPTAFRVDSTAKMWVYRTKAVQRAGQFAYWASSDARIYKRDVWPTGLHDYAGNLNSISNY